MLYRSYINYIAPGGVFTYRASTTNRNLNLHKTYEDAACYIDLSKPQTSDIPTKCFCKCSEHALFATERHINKYYCTYAIDQVRNVTRPLSCHLR